MWNPVRTRVSIRQESQFEFDRPDIWQLWSGRWCIVYGNVRFDFNHRDVSPLWFGRVKPVMEITCSWRASVRTIEPSRLDDVLIQERFLRGIFEKILSHSCPSGRSWPTVRTAPRQIFPDAHSDPQIINRGPWALRAARIWCWILYNLETWYFL
jgi:hypothetical protein